jgi:hypothetical protein
VIQVGFAYATYAGKTGSYRGFPSVAWDIVFGLLTSAHQKKGDAWFVTAPAGNQNSSKSFYPAALATTVVPSPAPNPSNAFANIVGVGSYTNSLDLLPADTVYNGQTYSNNGSWVTASADGSGVLSTFITNFNGAVQDNPTSTRSFASGYATWNGTSFASPKVAAALAAVVAANPGAMTPGTALSNIQPGATSSTTLGVQLTLW